MALWIQNLPNLSVAYILYYYQQQIWDDGTIILRLGTIAIK